MYMLQVKFVLRLNFFKPTCRLILDFLHVCLLELEDKGNGESTCRLNKN